MNSCEEPSASSTNPCTRRLLTDKAARFANLPAKFAESSFTCYATRYIDTRWAIPWNDDKAFLSYITDHKFIKIVGGDEPDRTTLAAALIKHTFRFRVFMPDPMWAHFGDAYDELDATNDAGGREYAHELSQYAFLALCNVQNIVESDIQRFRAMMWKRLSRFCTILTAESNKDFGLSRQAQEIISSDARFIEL